MRARTLVVTSLSLCTLGLAGPTAVARTMDADQVLRMTQSPEAITERLGRYVPADLGVKADTIAPELLPMLPPLRRAADWIDAVYWQQYAPEAREMLEAVRGDGRVESQGLARLLSLEYGPWDRHGDDKPFVGRIERPPGVGFYPHDSSRRELDAWVREHPASARSIWNPYTIVKRQNGSLVSVPYSKAWPRELQAAASALREAAGSYQCTDKPCPCAGLESFLKARAQSLLDDDYRSSELVWLESSDCPLDIAIGPYEFYADRLLGLKAAFGAIIYYRDDDASQRYARLIKEYRALVAALPVPDALRSRFLTARPSPITIADVLYTSGDSRAGFQVRAFILPNDEQVREAKGTKNVILQNVVRAKFERLVKPIAKRSFGPRALAELSADAYFDFLLAWQMAHAAIPGDLVLPGGEITTSRAQLRNRYTLIDSLKGEVVALLNYIYLLDKGLLKSGSERKMAVTYLASLLDSMRQSESSPQTIARTIVYNALAERDVIRYDPRTKMFDVYTPPLRMALRKLATETLQILARGDYDGAGRLIVERGIIPGEIRQKLAELHGAPLELDPNYISMPEPEMATAR